MKPKTNNSFLAKLYLLDTLFSYDFDIQRKATSYQLNSHNDIPDFNIKAPLM